MMRPMADTDTRLIAGAMTGTSIDGIDVALVRVTGRGLDMSVEFVRGDSQPLGSLAELLRDVANQKGQPIGDAARYANLLGVQHAAALKQLVGDDTLDFAVVHGQTVYHENDVTLQMVNVHPIAAALGVPVAYDLRGADLATGGQGAPVTPLADLILYGSADESRAIVNLGGFANYTILSATTAADAIDHVRGGDICACNQLLDYIARRWLDCEYDEGGAAAQRGIVHPEAEQFLRMMLEGQADGGRSLGTGDEQIAINWSRTFQNQCSGEDLAATACSVIGSLIAETCGDVDRIILAGGGALNATLVDAIRAGAGRTPVVSSDDVCAPDAPGVPGRYREAIAMAVLGAASQDGLPLTLASVTGRNADACPKPAWVHP